MSQETNNLKGGSQKKAVLIGVLLIVIVAGLWVISQRKDEKLVAVDHIPAVTSVPQTTVPAAKP